MTRALRVALVLALLAVPARAYDFAAGERVRTEAPGVGVVVGRVRAVEGGRLQLDVRGQPPLEVRIGTASRLEVGRRRRHAAAGARVGAALGLACTLAAGVAGYRLHRYADFTDRSANAFLSMGVAGAMTIPLGAGLGAAVGSAVVTEDWYDVRPVRVGVSFGF